MNLVEDNIGLAHYVAHEYENCGIEYEDLASVAVVGLVKAAKEFDASLGYKFSTFATKYARGEILNYIRSFRKSVSAVSFEQPIVEDATGITVEDVIEDDNDWTEKFIEHEDLQRAMNELSAREKVLIEMKYFSGMKQKEIARKMGLSKSRCALLTKKAIEKMRTAMTKERVTTKQ